MTAVTTTWSPLPGSLCARALAWFADQAPHAEVSTAVIADALEQPIASVVMALEPAFEHGLIAREKRDGRYVWSTAERPQRPLGAPPPVCADDDDLRDLLPVRQRTVPANPTKETAMPTTPPVAPPQPAPKAKKPRAAPPTFDPASFEVKKGRPMPPNRTAADSRYKALLERLAEPGDSFDLPPAVAKGLTSAAKKAGIKLATRVLSDTVTGVWRL